jgi:hypothetical protein
MSILEYGSDLAQAEPPVPLPPGPYPAEIIAASEKVSTNTGGKYLNIVFRIHSESYPADYTEGDPDGTELHYNRLQTDDTGRNRFRMRQFLERVGAPLSNRVDLNSLIGLTATVEITHQEYEGEQRAQIARILAP